jgi:predicted nucleotide-binding protein (sugar kinase/HSP70/actin superfamily)
MSAEADKSRTLYFPYMRDGAYALAAASRFCGVDARVLPMQTAEDVRLGRKHLSGKECFPMICTTGSFLKKMLEPGFEPSRSAFFMPDHRGPCRFGQYNKMQRIIFDRLGFGEVQIVAPSNADSYAGLSAGKGMRFRYAALRGIIAADMLCKLRQERRPYEATPGETERVYRQWLDRVVEATERGARGLPAVLEQAAKELDAVPLAPEWRERRKPVIAVVGEIFMRDNPYCSAFIVKRLEALGAETLMAPMWEWLEVSTLRYARDSRWKGDRMGVVKARIQELLAGFLSRDVVKSVEGFADMEREVGVEEMLERCEPYIHRDYDGDPAMALGSASALADTGISGVAAIQPFSCLPGTIVSSLSGSFRRDHDDMPWINVDFDGQEDTSIETRLQAFMHQANEYARSHDLCAPRVASGRR